MALTDKDLMESYCEQTLQESRAINEAYKAESQSMSAWKIKFGQAELEAYKAKVAALQPVYEARREITRKVQKFWLDTFQRQSSRFQLMIDQADEAALAHLTDFFIEYKPDPREYDMIFEFSPDNPFFSNKTLVKSYRLAEAPKEPAEIDISAQRSYFVSYPVVTSPVSIDWTSDEHDLTKKRPRVDASEMEEFDELSSLGSFFNFFTEASDVYDVGETLLECFNTAHDVYAGLILDIEDGDDEDSDDDPNAEIDIESSDEDKGKRPSKRQRKA